MKTYNIILPVFADIRVSVQAENEEEAKEKALEKAIEEQPLVTWEVDKEIMELRYK